MKPPEEIEEEQSRRIFWVIQTVFSLVLARSFLVYKDCVLHPLSADHLVTTVGLVLVYGTALWSWIDYSYTTIASPYRFGKSGWEKWRFLVDLIIVISYAFLLFTLERLLPNGDIEGTGPDANILPLFVCLTFIFVMYWVSGILRQAQYGSHVSSTRLILIFMGLNGAVAYTYRFAPASVAKNYIAIIAALALLIAYRVIRSRRRKRKHYIAVDIDGVLANQIEGILPLASSHAGKKLEYADIDQWDLKLGDTDIAKIITGEQKNNKRYVLGMPVHQDAQSTVADLIHKYRIAIVTARSDIIDGWTRRWISENRIYWDVFVHSKEHYKQNIDIDPAVLIDDYPGNIENFLNGNDAAAILFDQPWNRDRPELDVYLAEGRLKVVEEWKQIPAAIEKLIDHRSGN